MYAIAVNGSPRKGGNTELLLKEVLSELDIGGWETELVKIGGTPIRGVSLKGDGDINFVEGVA